MKNDFDGLIRRLDTVEESICELGNVSIETSKTEKQREKKTKHPLPPQKKKRNKQNIQELCDNYKGFTHV